jgi:hypothetical protein
MDNVSLPPAIRLIPSVTGKIAPPAPTSLPTQRCLRRAGGGESRRDSARSPRLEALKQCATRLHAIYVDRLVQRCTGDAIEHGVDAITIMRRGRLLPRYQQLLQRLLNNCVVDGDYRCADGRYPRPSHRSSTAGITADGTCQLL